MAIPAHSFTITADRIVRTLSSPVDICMGFDPNSNVPHPQFYKFAAIWDTGATGTVITQRVVETCDLKPIGMTQVRGVNSIKNCEVYLINIRLPNRVAFPFLKVTKGDVVGTDVLVGMDIINRGDFAVTNKDGRTVFSFRVPSLECIDFVKKSPVKSDKIGRNDPCPCRSGKKYKHCCGKKG